MAAPPISERHKFHFHRQSPIKESVRVATTANITIATALNNGDVLDGITLATDDRVLVKDQSTGSQNGIYVVGTSPVRAYDESSDDPGFGFLVYVREGTVNGGKVYRNTNTTTPTIATTALTFAQITATAVASLGWFNVVDYGAVGDGSTDDTAAVNLAIAALNTATKGVLYFPAGTYKCTSALTTITASGTILGDGMGAYDGSAYVSAVLQTSATANLFTITGKTVLFRDIGLFNTNAGTPSAGAGIQVSGAFIGQKVDLDSVVVSGFYINVDRQVGSQWVNHNVWNWKAVLYGEKIQNTVNQDAGDWEISGCNYYADTHNPTALIRQEGAGGGKIVGSKFNGHSGATATNSLLVAIPTGRATSVLTVAGNSFENMSGDAILITTTGTGQVGAFAIAGNQFGLYSNNTGRAVKIVAAATGGVAAAGGIGPGTIDGITAITDGTARALVELTKTDSVTVGDFSYIGFNARYTSSGDTNTTDGGGAPTTADYLVGTAQSGLSAEIVVGTTPGGELGNTWASPTVDTTHSGSSHAATQAAAEATAAAALAAHVASGGSGSDHEHVANIVFSGDGSTTVWELPAAPVDATGISVYVTGARSIAWVLSGTLLTTLTFDAAPASASNNIVIDIEAAV